MPSSTSSSDITYREIPERPWPRLLAAALVFMVIAMIGWEILARSLQHKPGTFHGFAERWAVERHKLDKPNNYRVVLTGSSRVLWASDLDILEEGFGTRPLQLALPGTGPALIVEDIVNNTEFDGLLVVGVTPFLFNRLDEGFFGGAALKRYKSESPSQWSGAKIHGFLSKYFGFLDDAFDLFKLVERYSDFPVREGAENLMQKDWKLGDGVADGQMDMWPPVEQVGSFDNTQITNFWSGGLGRPPEKPERMAEMASETLAFFTPLVEKLRERGGDMVFIRMPSEGGYLKHDIKTDYRGLTWDVMVKDLGAPAIHTFDYPQLSTDLDIPEWSHLSRASQDLWSRDIVPVIEQTYEQYRGHSVYDIIKAEP
jgi:hypothetical protein